MKKYQILLIFVVIYMALPVQLNQHNLLFDSIDSFLLSQTSAETRRRGLERILSALTCFDRIFRYEKKNKPMLRHSGATVGETSQLKVGSSSGKLFCLNGFGV